ncbi:MAG: NAD(P)H-hydrate dehydratase [Deltaproteobacteria bacterium]|nr:NAD(P)H-hydrate dehydratase [Deltaproteobacteria bacterium]
MKLADSAIIREMDRRAVADYGIESIQLMENAGRGVAEAVLRVLAAFSSKRVSILAGKGNNGGDGYVAARRLKNAGADVTVFALSRVEELKGDALANAGEWALMGGQTVAILTPEDLEKSKPALKHSSIIVDAIFGTGLRSDVEGVAAVLIDFVNGLDKTVVAVDIPSGIDAGSGRILGRAIKASFTVTMAMPKVGLVLYPGRDYAGPFEIVDIGAPRGLIDDTDIKYNLITAEMLRGILKPRRPDTHKTTYGHLLVLAGSPGMTGAAYMTAMAAMRTGAGLVTAGVPESLHNIMEAKTIEVMTAALPETTDKALGPVSWPRIREIIKNKTALVMGPGVGNRKDIYLLIEKIASEIEVPLLIDADGLNALAEDASVLKTVSIPVVLTPHPGEMARLLKTTAGEVQADRIGAATRLATLTGATIVLKGAGTVIAGADGQVYINTTGNAGLATAGTGDILAGMIGSLLAQGYAPLEASIAGAHVHGLAGDAVKDATGETGMIATDLLPRIPLILNSFTRKTNG